MKKNLIWAVTICLVFIGSCVTVNIYFPAAAEQKAADKIIEDIQGTDQKPVQGSWLHKELMGISFGSSSAFAAETDLEITTPGILAIRDASAMTLKEKATLNSLVGQQNEDIASLYQEIARANHLSPDAGAWMKK
jgi:uncharacterized protein YdbL (DUF1318 family)